MRSKAISSVRPEGQLPDTADTRGADAGHLPLEAPTARDLTKVGDRASKSVGVTGQVLSRTEVVRYGFDASS